MKPSLDDPCDCLFTSPPVCLHGNIPRRSKKDKPRYMDIHVRYDYVRSIASHRLHDIALHYISITCVHTYVHTYIYIYTFGTIWTYTYRHPQHIIIYSHTWVRAPVHENQGRGAGRGVYGPGGKACCDQPRRV